ncbi:MAG: hypothetical protein AAGI28_11760 [Pseudomonadota bacterium]
MDADLVLIFLFILLMTTIIGLTINGIVSKVLNYKRDKAGIPRFGAPTKKADNGLDDRTGLMEDRLQVLERLATDRGTLLSDEIEALRNDVQTRHEKETSQ